MGICYLQKLSRSEGKAPNWIMRQFNSAYLERFLWQLLYLLNEKQWNVKKDKEQIDNLYDYALSVFIFSARFLRRVFYKSEDNP